MSQFQSMMEDLPALGRPNRNQPPSAVPLQVGARQAAPLQDVPFFRDEEGQLVVGMPENYNWFDAFMDRRLYAVTEGGAGYWFGGRNPARIFYDWVNGPLDGAEPDQKWIEYLKDPVFLDTTIKNVKTSLGLSEELIKADYGEEAIRYAVMESVSSDNLGAKIGMMLDTAESKRRLETYDQASSWGTYLTSKVTSGLGNYAFVDTPSAVITAATLGSGFWVGPALKGTMALPLLRSVPWAKNAPQVARSWMLAHRGRTATATIGINTTDGALAGYAYWSGRNKDQELLLGPYGDMDENRWDDIAFGAAFGVAGGVWSHSVNMKQLTRAASIEALATSNAVTGVPTEYGLEWATKFVTAHERFVRDLRRSGLEQSNPVLFRQLSDAKSVRANAGLTIGDMESIRRTIKGERIRDADTIRMLVDRRLVREQNNAIGFRNKIIDVLNKAGIIVADGEAIDFTAQVSPSVTIGDLISKALRDEAHVPVQLPPGVAGRSEEVTMSINEYLKHLYTKEMMDMTDDEIMLLIDVTPEQFAQLTQRDKYNMLREVLDPDAITEVDNFFAAFADRAGITEMDFHQWLWLRKSTDPEFEEEFGQLLHHTRVTRDEETTIIRRFFDEIPKDMAALERRMSESFRSGEQPLSKVLEIASTPDFDGNWWNPLFSPGKLLTESEAFNRLPERYKKIVTEIDALIVRLGEFERNFHTRGYDLEDGYPKERLADWVNNGKKSRQELEVELRQKWNEYGKMLEADKSPAVVLDLFKKQLLYFKSQVARNQLLEVRLKRAMIAEEVGLLNTVVNKTFDNPFLYDGAFPFRTAVRNKTAGGDVMAERYASQTNQRLNRTLENIRDLGAQVPEGVTPLTRATNEYNVAKKFQLFLDGLGEQVEQTGVLSWATYATQISQNNLAEIETVLRNKGILDAAGNIDKAKLLQYAKSGERINLAKAGIMNALGNNKNKYKQIIQQLNNGSYNMPDDWSFAVANGAITGLRILGAGKLANFAIKIMGKTMDWQGASSSRLWFNSRATQKIPGMDSFSAVLFLSNLIDSPHVLRRDFGNIIDLRLFSAQQIRNFNARHANDFIVTYRKLVKAGNAITDEDNIEVINAVLTGNMTNINTPVRTELHKAARKFFDNFTKDIEDVLITAGVPTANINKIRDRMIKRAIYGSIDRGSMLANRGKIRTAIDKYLLDFVDDTIARMRAAKLGGTPLVRLRDADIAAANTKADLVALLENTGLINKERMHNSWTKKEGRQLTDILAVMKDSEVANLKTYDELMDLIDNIRSSPEFMQNLNTRADELVNMIDPAKRLSNAKRQGHNMSTTEISGILAKLEKEQEVLEESIYELLSDYRIQSLPDLVVNYAQQEGVRLRMQAQLSRSVGDINIFQMIQETRDHLTGVGRSLARTDRKFANMEKEVNRTMDDIEDRLANALGYSLETREGRLMRTGVGENLFRLQNGMIRASVGSFFGLQTAIAEIPKALLLNWNRNGMVEMILDLISAVTRKEDLDDLGAAIEQYTYRYALGLDNEKPMGNIRINRIPLTRITTGQAIPSISGGVSAARGIGRRVQQVAGLATGQPPAMTRVDPAGTVASMIEKGKDVSGRLGAAADLFDATVGAVEGLANVNQRLGGLQYFTAIGKDIAVRGAKRQLVRNIGNLKAFAKEFRARNLDALPYDQRLVEFKKLAKKHNVNWDLAARLNHHGLLDESNLNALSVAFRDKNVVRKSGDPYVLERLRESLDNQLPGQGEEVDDIINKLTVYMEEQASTALNMSTIIGSSPDANLLQRWLFQFSGYARGFQHQTILRGMNDSTMSKMMAMLIPVLVGEIVYTTAKKYIAADGYRDPTKEQAMFELKEKWRRNPELALYEVLSRIPVGGAFQSFMMNYAINPLLNRMPDTRNTVFETIHSGAGPIPGIHDVLGKDAPEAIKDVPVLRHAYPFAKKTAEAMSISPTYNADGIYLPEAGIFRGDVSPFSDMWNAAKMLDENPYRDMSTTGGLTGFPNGMIYNAVPGRRTWEFELGLRLFTDYPGRKDYNSRARRYDTR